MYSAQSNKIALFLGALHGGGAQRVMIHIATGLVERGVKVDLVLANARGEYMYNLPDNINVINLNSGRVLYSIYGLAKYLRKERPYSLLSTVAHANLAAIIASKLARVKTRLFIRVENTISKSSADDRDIKSTILKLLIRHIYSWADGVISPSSGVANDLISNLKLQDSLLHVIYNPVSSSLIAQKIHEKVNHPWFDASDVPVVVAVGRLTKQKDFISLVQAMSIVNRKVIARLVILGEGEMRTELESMIKKLGLEDSVSLPGFVDNPYAYMARSSVFVLSSLWEGLPNTLIEAMAVGIPVVATNCESGPDEVLSNGKYGWLAEVGSPESIAEGIVHALTSDNFPKPDINAMKRFDQSIIVDQYMKLLLG